jgi:hypothetical protein
MTSTSPNFPLKADPLLLEIAMRLQLRLGLTPHGAARFLEPPNEARCREIAFAYDAQRHDPTNPKVVEAYRALKEGINEQFRALQAAGYVIRPWKQEGQPYANSTSLREDVVRNKSIMFFCGGEFMANHPLNTYSGITIAGHPLIYNDLLRVVHDILGHSLFGNGWGRRGELLAARVHLEMFEPGARAVLFTETAAQTCWFYFGPHANVFRRHRPFAAQKAVLLPAQMRYF